MKLIFEKSVVGRRGAGCVDSGVEQVVKIPPQLLRDEPAELPELSELDVVRHFTELSRRNFGVDNGFYPKGSNGLEDLIEEPSDATNWRGPYLKQGIPLDPWKNEYIYEYPGKRNENGYDLMSMGPDGKIGGDDDLINWSEDRR